MQLEQGEEILFKEKPFSSIKVTITMTVASIIGLVFWSLTEKHLIALASLLFLGLLRHFDYLIITNKNIRLCTFFNERKIKLENLNHSPYLVINPDLFKISEWQRKLLKEELMTFWKYQTSIQFSEKSDKKILHQLQLSLFSKKQTDKILAILTQTWNLDSNIKQPN